MNPLIGAMAELHARYPDAQLMLDPAQADRPGGASFLDVWTSGVHVIVEHRGDRWGVSTAEAASYSAGPEQVFGTWEAARDRLFALLDGEGDA